MIWFQNYSIKDLNEVLAKGMCGFLGIKALEIGPDFIKAEMPVGERTTQPFGILHRNILFDIFRNSNNSNNITEDHRNHRTGGKVFSCI